MQLANTCKIANMFGEPVYGDYRAITANYIAKVICSTASDPVDECRDLEEGIIGLTNIGTAADYQPVWTASSAIRQAFEECEDIDPEILDQYSVLLVGFVRQGDTNAVVCVEKVPVDSMRITDMPGQTEPLITAIVLATRN